MQIERPYCLCFTKKKRYYFNSIYTNRFLQNGIYIFGSDG